MENRPTETVSPEETPQSSIRILSPGCEIGDRYEIRGVLGIGGCGVVYAVWDRDLKRSVALKVLRSDRISDSSLLRFRREVSIARDVHSPHLVRVFDIAQWGDSTYMTMELIEGESLAARLARGPLPVADTIDIGLQILTALEELHRVGVVHRDIKPSNVMLTADGRVKLTDFGLARYVASETRATETETVVGTYEYLSPEQALGWSVDTRSDLYSFGILLYECLVGQVPHRASSAIGTALAHVSKDAPDVRAGRKETPRWLARVVARLLTKTREDRYQTVVAVREDLRQRRAPEQRLRRMPIVVGTLVVVIAALAAFAVREYSTRRFARLVSDGNGVRAVDRTGDVLWSDPELLVATEVIATPGSAPLIAAARRRAPGSPSASHQLLLLDATTGAARGSVDLPDMSDAFPDFSNRYSAMMTTLDLDRDGGQELFVSYAHHPYWPSYVVMVDPRNRTARAVFIGAGRHAPLGTLDVDGDGRDELILWGISNRMGWYSGLAAVKIDPSDYAIGSTPNETYVPAAPNALVWYALVGDGFEVGTKFSIDRERRVIEVVFADGSRTAHGADGFELGRSAQGDPAKRAAARARSYDALRDAKRLSRTGYADDARERVAEAVADADAAADEPLAAWARRVQLNILIAHGATQAEFEPLLREVTRRFAAADAYWEVARALHLRGDLEDAIRWYREGLRLRASNPRGRLSWEFVEGIVFAFAELGRWEDAREAFELYARTHDAVYPHYRSWIEWRATDRVSFDVTSANHDVDEAYYLALESDAAQAGARPAALRATVARERERFSEAYRWIALSLEADLTARSGDIPAALPLARKAYDEVHRRLTSEVAARAHFDLVAKRYANIANAAGATAEAKRATEALEKFRIRSGAVAEISPLSPPGRGSG